jgi:hypothetical protein
LVKKKVNGAIILRCGDSRNGSAEKALKEHFERPPEERVKTITFPGGAHYKNARDAEVLHQIEIYSGALLERGATRIYIVVTDHRDCAYVNKHGKSDIVKRWTKKQFLRTLFAIHPAIHNLSVMTIDYHSHEKPVIPAREVELISLASVDRF